MDGPKPVKLLVAVAGFVRLLFAIVVWRCDLIHVHTASRASFMRKSRAALVGRAFRRRVIVHVHGGGFGAYFDEAVPATRDAIRRTLGRADLVLALSERWRTRLKEMSPEALVKVLVNPVDTRLYSPLARRRPEVPEDGGTVLFLGAFTRRKGTYDLIEAISRVAAKRPSVRLELGGDCEVREVVRFGEEMGVAANVKVMGWIVGQDKTDAFARAHVLALPSYIEGVPMAVLEALAAGLPVVATPVGGIPDVIEDGVNGLLVQPGDVDALAVAILRVLSDAELRTRMSEANQALAAQRHDARIVAATLCSYYEEVLSGSVASAPLGESRRAGSTPETTRRSEAPRAEELE